MPDTCEFQPTTSNTQSRTNKRPAQAELTQPEAEVFEQAIHRQVARLSVQAVALAVEAHCPQGPR